MKEIPGYEGLYSVTEDGKVYSHRNERYLSPCGVIYEVVQLSVGNRKTTFYIHRLVAEAFIPNPLGLKEVNHIDGNKTNNNVSNLEWATYTHNLLHAYRTGLRNSTKGMKYKPRKVATADAC